MGLLVQMFNEGDTIKELSLPERTMIFQLAHSFEQSHDYLFADPEELVGWTQKGTKDKWQEFLQFPETQAYVRGQMAFFSQVAQRKTYKELLKMALNGNQQAAKQVQEISGIMNQQDNNRTIVLHRIPRPEDAANETVKET